MNEIVLYKSFIIIFTILIVFTSIYATYYIVQIAKWLYKSYNQNKENYKNLTKFHDNGE